MNGLKEFLQWFFESVRILIVVQSFETGIRIRFGKKVKKLSSGVYFRLPYFDSIYIQESRLRIVALPLQTLTTKDGKTITLNGSIGYLISDIEVLYDNLYHPEISIQNIAMANITSFVYDKRMEDLKINNITESVMDKLKRLDYGIDFKYFEITNFAVVKTYRLITDKSWVDEGLQMNVKS